MFVDNEQLLRVKDQFGRAMYLNSRISPDTIVPLDKTVPRYLDLYEAIIVGHNGAQVTPNLLNSLCCIIGIVWGDNSVL